jgi:anti-anti-sigma factor
MDILQSDHTLMISGIRDLSGTHAHSIRDNICSALTPNIESIEVDLSQTTHVDGYGVGALVALYKAASVINNQRPPAMRLLYPQPEVQQVLELTRLHHMFEIIPCAVNPVTASPLLMPVPPVSQSAAAV